MKRGAEFYLNGEKIAVASGHDSKGVTVASFQFDVGHSLPHRPFNTLVAYFDVFSEGC